MDPEEVPFDEDKNALDAVRLADMVAEPVTSREPVTV